jgi:hypothetical protein
MASHFAPAIRARSLSNVLKDLKEAHRDLHNAIADFDDPEDSDVDDRCAEAETRVYDLREEFAERFVETTGLTWRDIETAISEAVL